MPPKKSNTTHTPASQTLDPIQITYFRGIQAVSDEDYNTALQLFSKALGSLSEEPHPTKENILSIARIEKAIGDIYIHTNHPEKALINYLATVFNMQKILSYNDVDHYRLLSTTEQTIADIYSNNNDEPNAEKYYALSIEHMRNIPQSLRNIDDYNILASTAQILAEKYLNKGDYINAKASYTKAIEDTYKLIELSPIAYHYTLLVGREQSLGDIYAETNDFTEATKYYLLSIRHTTDAFKKDKTLVQDKEFCNLFLELLDTVTTGQESKVPMDIIERCKVVQEIWSKHLDKKMVSSNITLAKNIASMFTSHGEHAQAKESYQFATKFVHKDNTDEASSIENSIGETCYAEGNITDARKYFVKAVTIKLPKIPATSYKSYTSIAQTYFDNGFYTHAVRIATKALDHEHSQRISLNHLLALSYERLGYYEKAKQHIDSTIDLQRADIPLIDQLSPEEAAQQYLLDPDMRAKLSVLAQYYHDASVMNLIHKEGLAKGYNEKALHLERSIENAIQKAKTNAIEKLITQTIEKTEADAIESLIEEAIKQTGTDAIELLSQGRKQAGAAVNDMDDKQRVTFLANHKISTDIIAKFLKTQTITATSYIQDYSAFPNFLKSQKLSYEDNINLMKCLCLISDLYATSSYEKHVELNEKYFGEDYIFQPKTTSLQVTSLNREYFTNLAKTANRNLHNTKPPFDITQSPPDESAVADKKEESSIKKPKDDFSQTNPITTLPSNEAAIEFFEGIHAYKENKYKDAIKHLNKSLSASNKKSPEARCAIYMKLAEIRIDFLLNQTKEFSIPEQNIANPIKDILGYIKSVESLLPHNSYVIAVLQYYLAVAYSTRYDLIKRDALKQNLFGPTDQLNDKLTPYAANTKATLEESIKLFEALSENIFSIHHIKALKAMAIFNLEAASFADALDGLHHADDIRKQMSYIQDNEEIAEDLESLFIAHHYLKQPKLTEPLLLQATAIRENLPNSLANRLQLSLNYGNLAMIYSSQSKLEETIKASLQGFEILKDCKSKCPDDFLNALFLLGRAYYHVKDYKNCIAVTEQWLNENRGLLSTIEETKTWPSTQQHRLTQHNLYILYNELAESYATLNEIPAAISCIQQLLSFIPDDEIQQLYASYTKIGDWFYKTESYLEAVQSHSKALEILKKSDAYTSAISYIKIGDAYKAMVEHEKTEPEAKPDLCKLGIDAYNNTKVGLSSIHHEEKIIEVRQNTMDLCFMNPCNNIIQIVNRVIHLGEADPCSVVNNIMLFLNSYLKYPEPQPINPADIEKFEQTAIKLIETTPNLPYKSLIHFYDVFRKYYHKIGNPLKVTEYSDLLISVDPTRLECTDELPAAADSAHGSDGEHHDTLHMGDAPHSHGSIA